MSNPIPDQSGGHRGFVFTRSNVSRTRNVKDQIEHPQLEQFTFTYKINKEKENA